MQIRNTPRVFAIEVIAEIFNNKIVISRKRKAEDEADEKEKEIVEKEWKKNFEVSADISKVKWFFIIMNRKHITWNQCTVYTNYSL